MELGIGIIIGILVCGFIYSTEFVLNRRQTSITKKFEKQLIKDLLPHVPSQKGAVLFSETLEQEARREIIERNDAAGKPTKLEDL